MTADTLILDPPGGAKNPREDCEAACASGQDACHLRHTERPEAGRATSHGQRQSVSGTAAALAEMVSATGGTRIFGLRRRPGRLALRDSSRDSRYSGDQGAAREDVQVMPSRRCRRRHRVGGHVRTGMAECA